MGCLTRSLLNPPLATSLVVVSSGGVARRRPGAERRTSRFQPQKCPPPGRLPPGRGAPRGANAVDARDKCLEMFPDLHRRRGDLQTVAATWLHSHCNEAGACLICSGGAATSQPSSHVPTGTTTTTTTPRAGPAWQGPDTRSSRREAEARTKDTCSRGSCGRQPRRAFRAEPACLQHVPRGACLGSGARRRRRPSVSSLIVLGALSATRGSWRA